MTTRRILIVDDQKEVARVLKSSLETLEQDIEVLTFLSGEEAILELTRESFDLLISDVRLPGISGLELLEKYKKQTPEMKFMLISGVTEPKIRQEVAQAGADAFFFKPIEIADFLDSVERILGIVDTILPHELHVEKEEALDKEKESTGMMERIGELRKELDASAVFLLGDHAQVLIRAGALPNKEIETVLIPNISPIFSSGAKISRFLGMQTPNNLLTFHGKDYDLYIAYVGGSYSLLITTPPQKTENAGTLSTAIQLAVEDIVVNLSNLGVSTHAQQLAEEDDSAPVKEKAKEEDLSDPELETLLADKPTKKIKKSEADAFWEKTAKEESTTEIPTGDSLTYEQALKLGLAPSDE